MKPLSVIAIEIYQSLELHSTNLTERREAVKRYILNEITQWKIKSLEQDNNYFFKPIEFIGDNNSSPFEVRLLKSKSFDGLHELKFGDLNAPDDERKFKWDDKDPYRLQKALFLTKVLDLKIKPLLDTKKIAGIVFQPYDEDGLADDRYSYFYNMFVKLGKDKYDLHKSNLQGDNTYFILPKV